MAGFADATKYGIEVDSGIPRGNMYHIACSTWFTATGKAMPQYFKFEDDNGDIQTVRDILVKYTEDKNYSGIPSREYGCDRRAHPGVQVDFLSGSMQMGDAGVRRRKYVRKIFYRC